MSKIFGALAVACLATGVLAQECREAKEAFGSSCDRAADCGCVSDLTCTGPNPGDQLQMGCIPECADCPLEVCTLWCTTDTECQGSFGPIAVCRDSVCRPRRDVEE